MTKNNNLERLVEPSEDINAETRMAESEAQHAIRLIDEGKMSLTYDKAFSTAMYNNRKLAQYFVDVVFGKGMVEIDSISTEEQLRFKIDGRAMILDVLCRDEKHGILVNIEMQKSNPYDIPLKMRLYQSYIDSTQHPTDTEIRDVKKLLMLYFVNGDLFGKGRLIYEPPEDYWAFGGRPFKDRVRRVIVNLAYKGDGDRELLNLVEDLNQTKLQDMHSNLMKNALELVLERGRIMWSKGFECGAYEYWVRHETEMFEKGKAESKEEIALNIYREEGFGAERISRLVGMSVPEVEAILKKTEL